MEIKGAELVNSCDLRGVSPIMMQLPYPPTAVDAKNQSYANLLSIDYCGSASEMTAIMQYINSESRLESKYCPMIKSILGIAMAEMIHLQKLGELIVLLGGKLDFTAKYVNERPKMWTPSYLSLPSQTREMLQVSIQGEQDAIRQYQRHISMIKDSNVNAVLARIVKDEEYHIMILQALV